jgi:hypothetical protein
MAAHFADKPARSLHHRSELVAEDAVGAANTVLRLAEGSSSNVVFFEAHGSYHNIILKTRRIVIIADQK